MRADAARLWPRGERVLRSLLAALLLANRVLAGEPSPNGVPDGPPSVPLSPGTPRLTGLSSCTASNCHGSAHERGIPGNEHAIWLEFDPHSRPDLERRNGRRIFALLELEGRPSEHPRCAGCHTSTPTDAVMVPGRPSAPQDAVSCESCHGGAEHWLVPHTRHDWRLRSPESRAALGFRSGRDHLADRIADCAGCHVGGPRGEVDHDLIAAGHPRLQFEMSGHFARLPRHWRRRGRSGIDDPATVWGVGQTVAAEVALRQLATRATDGRHAWPELSEYRCDLCHRPVPLDSSRDLSPIESGRQGLHPSSWYYGSIPFLLAESGPVPLSTGQGLSARQRQLLEGLTHPRTGRLLVATNAAQLADRLAAWNRSASQSRPDLPWLRRQLGPTCSESQDADEATQWYLLTHVTLLSGIEEGRLDAPQQAQLRREMQQMRGRLKAMTTSESLTTDRSGHSSTNRSPPRGGGHPLLEPR